MVHPMFVSSSMRGQRGMGPKSQSLSNLQLSGKIGKGGQKLSKLPPILEQFNETDSGATLRPMADSKSVPDLHGSAGAPRENKEERTNSRERRPDPFYDF